ncbi:MAG: phosphatase PAP2 family protein [Bacteroidia bacterium]
MADNPENIRLPRLRDVIHDHPFFFYPYFLLLLFTAIAMGFYDYKEMFFSIHGLNAPFWDDFFYYGTYLGDGLLSFFVAAMLLFVRYRLAIAAGITFIITGIVAQLLKNFVFEGRHRPFRVLTEAPDFNVIEGLELHSYHSFPSGHTATGFAIFAFLALVIKRPPVSILCFLIAVMVGYSRIYLGQHFFVDVYAGSVVGVTCAILGYWFLEVKKPGKLLRKNWMEKSLLRN